MKKLIFIIVLLLIFTSCNAQHKDIIVKQKKHLRMNIPNITKDNLGVPKLSDLVKAKNEKIFEKTKDSSKLLNKNENELVFEHNDFSYKYKDGKLVLIGRRKKDDIQKPIPRRKEHFNSPKEFTQNLQTTIEFYPNENVHMIRHWINTPNGYYPAGNWYVYDEAGNLLQHIDHEKYFRMSYYDVGKIADSYDYPSIIISRSFDGKNNSFWIIQLEGLQDQPIEPKTIIIDDKTGKVLFEMNQEEFNNFRGLDNMEQYGKQLYHLFESK
ncbi:hypothetical protein [Chryseobacterium sp. POE27]|uniref:hypothetical protein n=1 Tax=Chryseobacterium sp. POE27 TaxID=3138177 RepID=UPI00321BF03E